MIKERLREEQQKLVLMRGTENADTAKTIRHIRSRSIMLDNFKWQPVGSDGEVLSREDEFSIQFTAKGHPKMFIRLEKPTGAIELKVSDFLVADDETALAAQVFRYASEGMGIRLSGRRIRATHVSTSDSNVEVYKAFDAVKAKFNAVLEHLDLSADDCKLDRKAGRNFDLVLQVA